MRHSCTPLARPGGASWPSTTKKNTTTAGACPSIPRFSPDNERDAAAYRAAAAGAELGLKYGPSPRQIVDLFPAPQAGPLAMFIHGGWWRTRDPSAYSHLAIGPNAQGVSVAVVGYDLCPQVSIATIIEQMRAACLYLWRKKHQRITVYGHSAGGHLAACMVATDWKTIAPDAPADLVPAGYSISGVFDLAPLTQISVNADLKLDDKSARACSPLFWRVPAGRTFDAVVGALRIERIPAPEPHRRGRLAAGKREDALRGDRRHQSFHRGRSAHGRK